MVRNGHAAGLFIGRGKNRAAIAITVVAPGLALVGVTWLGSISWEREASGHEDALLFYSSRGGQLYNVVLPIYPRRPDAPKVRLGDPFLDRRVSFTFPPAASCYLFPSAGLQISFFSWQAGSCTPSPSQASFDLGRVSGTPPFFRCACSSAGGTPRGGVVGRERRACPTPSTQVGRDGGLYLPASRIPGRSGETEPSDQSKLALPGSSSVRAPFAGALTVGPLIHYPHSSPRPCRGVKDSFGNASTAMPGAQHVTEVKTFFAKRQPMSFSMGPGSRQIAGIQLGPRIAAAYPPIECDATRRSGSGLDLAVVVGPTRRAEPLDPNRGLRTLGRAPPRCGRLPPRRPYIYGDAGVTGYALRIPSQFPSPYSRSPFITSSTTVEMASKGSSSSPQLRPWARSTATMAALESLVFRGLLCPRTAQEERISPHPSHKTPSPPAGYVVSFMAYHVRGFAVPAHRFVREVLYHFGVELHALSTNGVQQMANFVALCEGYLGIEPDFNLFLLFFKAPLVRPHGVLVPWGYYSLQAKQSRVDKFTRSELRGSNKDWNKGCPSSVRPRELAAGQGAGALVKLAPHLDCLAKLRSCGLTGIGIAEAFHRRRVAPLMARPLCLFEMLPTTSEAELCASLVSRVVPSEDEVRARLVWGSWIRGPTVSTPANDALAGEDPGNSGDEQVGGFRLARPAEGPRARGRELPASPGLSLLRTIRRLEGSGTSVSPDPRPSSWIGRPPRRVLPVNKHSRRRRGGPSKTLPRSNQTRKGEGVRLTLSPDRHPTPLARLPSAKADLQPRAGEKKEDTAKLLMGGKRTRDDQEEARNRRGHLTLGWGLEPAFIVIRRQESNTIRRSFHWTIILFVLRLLNHSPSRHACSVPRVPPGPPAPPSSVGAGVSYVLASSPVAGEAVESAEAMDVDAPAGAAAGEAIPSAGTPVEGVMVDVAAEAPSIPLPAPTTSEPLSVNPGKAVEVIRWSMEDLFGEAEAQARAEAGPPTAPSALTLVSVLAPPLAAAPTGASGSGDGQGAAVDPEHHVQVDAWLEALQQMRTFPATLLQMALTLRSMVNPSSESILLSLSRARTIERESIDQARRSWNAANAARNEAAGSAHRASELERELASQATAHQEELATLRTDLDRLHSDASDVRSGSFHLLTTRPFECSNQLGDDLAEERAAAILACAEALRGRDQALNAKEDGEEACAELSQLVANLRVKSLEASLATARKSLEEKDSEVEGTLPISSHVSDGITHRTTLLSRFGMLHDAAGAVLTRLGFPLPEDIERLPEDLQRAADCYGELRAIALGMLDALEVPVIGDPARLPAELDLAPAWIGALSMQSLARGVQEAFMLVRSHYDGIRFDRMATGFPNEFTSEALDAMAEELRAPAEQFANGLAPGIDAEGNPVDGAAPGQAP
nr:unnamed protein product [Digitaria exilis]